MAIETATGVKQTTEMTAEVNPATAGAPDAAQMAPEVPFWDLTPKGPQGNIDGAYGRQRARMEYLISIGVLAEGLVEGVFEREHHDPKQKRTTKEVVIACEPIPLSQMMPDQPRPQEVGYVTPLWPAQRSPWLMNGDLSLLPPEEE